MLLIACLRSLASFGMAVSYNVVTGPPSQDVFSEMRALLGRSLALRTFSMHTFDADRGVRPGLMQEAIDFMANGQFQPAPANVIELSRVREAHELLDAGVSLGKIVLIS